MHSEARACRSNPGQVAAPPPALEHFRSVCASYVHQVDLRLYCRWILHHVRLHGAAIQLPHLAFNCSLFGPAVLCGPAALQHHLIQLLAVKDDGEEVDLPFRLGLGLLCMAGRGRMADTGVVGGCGMWVGGMTALSSQLQLPEHALTLPTATIPPGAQHLAICRPAAHSVQSASLQPATSRQVFI